MAQSDKEQCKLFLDKMERLIEAKYDCMTRPCVENSIALYNSREAFMDSMLELY